MKSGNLNFLETPSPVQACNGTALPLLNISYEPRTAPITNTQRKSTDLRNRLSVCVLLHIAQTPGHLESRNWRKLPWAVLALTQLRVFSLTYVATLRPEASRIIMSNNNMGAFICLPFLWFPVVWTFHIAHINSEQRCSDCGWACSLTNKETCVLPCVNEVHVF